MKSIKQIIRDVQQVFEDKIILGNRQSTGRPAKSRQAIFRSFLAKLILQIQTNTLLLCRLRADINLRRLCGFTRIKDLPSESVLSRAFSKFAEEEICQKIHGEMTAEHISDILIGHISRDSTAIHARKKPVNLKKDVASKIHKRKRGRPRKGEIVEPKELTMIEKQVDMDAYKALQELNLEAAWGCKVNSQGKKNHWKGYKLHLDVTDFGLPVTAVLTGANVYDNQLAIPMEKITGDKITYLYSLMDAAYDAEIIDQFITSEGRIPIIDSNKRRGKKDN